MDPEQVAVTYNVSRESLDRLRTYVELVVKWNSRINLVSPSTIEDIWTRHIADSLQLIPHLPRGCHRIVDLGSGAGFPGLALAIASGIPTILVESNTKKAAFLGEVIRKTGAPAEVRHGRIEAAASELQADAVTARALAPLPRLIELALPLLSQGAQGLFLKGQDVEAELTESAKYWKMDYQIHPSTTDPHGVVLVLKEISRA